MGGQRAEGEEGDAAVVAGDGGRDQGSGLQPRHQEPAHGRGRPRRPRRIVGAIASGGVRGGSVKGPVEGDLKRGVVAMNAERLLEHYEKIAEAPDAIPKLRRFILDLAVRGKLVPQDPNDTVGEKYLDLPTTANFPENWRTLNFGKHCDIEGGSQPPKSSFIDEPKAGYVRLLQIRDLGENPVPTYIPVGSTNRFCKEGEILIGRYGASIGKIFWAQEGAYNVALAKFIWPHDAYVKTFAYLLLKSDIFQTNMVGASRSAQAGFNKSDLASINFPLPPLAEQQRIVAKVDELMGICDRLEVARKEREAIRDGFTTSTLGRLSVADESTFRSDASFAIEHLRELTTRPDQIKQLRQTILNLAVRGKFSQKEDWQLKPIKLGDVATLQNGYAFKSEWFARSGIRLLRNVNVGHGRVNWNESVCISEAKALDYERFRLHPGDVILSLDRPFIVTGTKVARIMDYDVPSLLLQRVGRFVTTSSILPEFLYLWIKSPEFSRQIDPGRSNGVPHISSKQVETAVFYLPPITEQRRIVTLANSLSAICRKIDYLLHGDLAEATAALEQILFAKALS